MVAMTPIPDRAAARLAWTRHVLDNASLTLEPASADASFRSYWRTRHAGRSWVVMDSPPAQGKDPDILRVDRLRRRIRGRGWKSAPGCPPPACTYRRCRRMTSNRASC